MLFSCVGMVMCGCVVFVVVLCSLLCCVRCCVVFVVVEVAFFYIAPIVVLEAAFGRIVVD